MNKKLLTLFIFGILLINIVSVQAAYFYYHEYNVLRGMDDNPNSDISRLCKGRESIMIDGATSWDIPVVHYTDKNKVGSYIASHSKFTGFDKCLENAGTDVDLQCYCYSGGTHIIVDKFFHTEGGFVPRYLTKYFSTNLAGHMATENDHDKKFKKYLDKINDPLFESGTLDFHDKNICSNLFEETGGDIKYLKLLTEVTGLTLSELKRDANAVCNGYKGEGFYATIYEEKISLPPIFWWISIGLIVIGLLVALGVIIIPLALGIKTTWWKYLIIFIYMFIAIIGILLIISIYTGTTWAWVNGALRVLPIRVSEADIISYDKMIEKEINEFYQTGNLKYDDASGLSYRDSNGVWREGALQKAEGRFKYLLMFAIAPFILLFNLFLVYKTFAIKRKGRLNKFMNILGFILFGILFILIVGDIVYIMII